MSISYKFFYLDIPDFCPQYEDGTVYGYDDKNGQKENLKDLLLKTSNLYCMYCYRRIVIDGVDYSNLEHAIEKGAKKNSKLRNCVPNIGLSCSYCNMSAKRRNEKKRIKDMEQTIEYSIYLKHNCKPSSCKEPCGDYKNLVRAYQAGAHGHICLQPGKTVFPDTGNVACLQYNILKGQFEPSLKVCYTNDEKRFLYDHISQFNLNDPQKRSNEFYRYCRDVINDNVNCKVTGHYNNMIVDLFISAVKDLSDNEVLLICQEAYKEARNVGRI